MGRLLDLLHVLLHSSCLSIEPRRQARSHNAEGQRQGCRGGSSRQACMRQAGLSAGQAVAHADHDQEA